MTKFTFNATPSVAPSHATIFIWLFAVSSIWHYTSSAPDIIAYWFRYDPVGTPLMFVAIATALIAACYPNRLWALMLMCLGQLVAIFNRYPFVADHLVMEVFLQLSILASYAWVAIRSRTLRVTVDELFAVFAPVGRWLLIIMYFYGTFHKINPGFMSPHSSCAVPFIGGFPILRDLLGPGWLEYAAIYGTLVFEAIAMLLLFSTRTKYYGMLLGMSFHFFVGISSFGTIAHFSAFALALHTLFLPSGFGQRIFTERLIPPWLKNEHSVRVATVLLIVLQVALALHLATSQQGYFVNTLFGLFAISVIYLVLKYGQMRPTDAPYRLKSPFLALNLVPVWFFVHCASPYIGLGTGGAMTMFSGLRTEGGISNHYLIKKPYPLFPYQDKVVWIESATNPSLQSVADDNGGAVMFDFQRHVLYREAPVLPLTVRVEGKVYEMNTPEDFIAFADEYFTAQSWFARKYMSFRIVDSPYPDRCRH